MPAATRFAAIDIGTNSIKLAIAERSEEGRLVTLLDTSLVTRLGENLNLCRLNEVAIRRTLDALADYRAICNRESVSEIAAVGTSALRDAVNRDAFLSGAAKIGLDVSVIAGDEEARLSFLAISRDPLWQDFERLVVIDVGGGSTEVIQGDRSGIERRTSMALGAVRLTESTIRSDPPTEQEIDRASRMAAEILEGIEPAPPNYAVVGVGGTLTNLGAIKFQLEPFDAETLHGAILDTAEIDLQAQEFASVALERRKKIIGLNPARADIILAGALILREVLARLRRGSIAISCRGLRWGLMYDRFGDDVSDLESANGRLETCK